MKKIILFSMATIMLLVSAATICAQNNTPPKEQGTNSKEKIKEDFKQLGNDFVEGINAAGESVSGWFKEQSEKAAEEAAGKPGSQSKFGVVISTNAKNNTVTVVTTDGKTVTFGVRETTIILVQDTVTALQTPFTGGKPVKFKTIRKGDWIHYSYNFGDVVKSVLPDSTADTIAALTLDILR